MFVCRCRCCCVTPSSKDVQGMLIKGVSDRSKQGLGHLLISWSHPVMLKTSADHLSTSSFQSLAVPICSPGFMSVNLPLSLPPAFVLWVNSPAMLWDPALHTIGTDPSRDTHKHSDCHSHSQHLSSSHTQTHVHWNTPPPWLMADLGSVPGEEGRQQRRGEERRG